MQPNSGNAAVAAANAERSDRPDDSLPATADAATRAATSVGAPATGQSSGEPELIAQLRAISHQLGVLTDREQERAAHREAVIDRLHAENQMLRRRELDQMLEPVRNGLYRLYDLTRREADRWWGETPPGPEHAAPLLALIADEIGEVLARTGVEPFGAEPGDPYDAARHRPVDAEDVIDPALDGAVIRVVASGFTRGEAVARRADVVVGQLSRRARPEAGTRPEVGTRPEAGTRSEAGSENS